jgi:hypothetical protein
MEGHHLLVGRHLLGDERLDPVAVAGGGRAGDGGGQGRIAARAQEQQRGEAEENRTVFAVIFSHRLASGPPEQAPDARGYGCKERATDGKRESTEGTEGERRVCRGKKPRSVEEDFYNFFLWK